MSCTISSRSYLCCQPQSRRALESSMESGQVLAMSSLQCTGSQHAERAAQFQLIKPPKPFCCPTERPIGSHKLQVIT